MTIKAIETKYNGYRFRSRLEARWAVFFDAIGIEYEYEKEGYEIKDYFDTKTWYYLPDFYLPETSTWCEVKGTRMNTDYLAMLCNVVDWESQLPYIENSGWTERGLMILPPIEPHEGSFAFPGLQHSKGVKVSRMCFTRNGIQCVDGGIGWCDASWGINECGKELEHILDTYFCYKDMMMEEDSIVKEAYEKALTARFEHGEMPTKTKCTKNNIFDI